MPTLFRFVVKDINGEEYNSRITELTKEQEKELLTLVEHFGECDRFSMTEPNGSVIGFIPKNCVYLKLESFKE